MVAAYKPPVECTSHTCLRGFVVQGTLRKWTTARGSGLIRNFSSLWEQLLQQGQDHHRPTHAGVGTINVTVLGKGKRRDLDIPLALDHRVEFYSGLSYPDFWQKIYSSYALVPAFGSNQYFKTRISSTVLASLTTCVPMIVTQKMLDVYSFFKEEHVFLQRPGEREVDVMMRILSMEDDVIFNRRRALCQLRQELGKLAAAVLNEALALAGVNAAADAGPGAGAAATADITVSGT
ncbi:hypothetical protein VOLCADRAFT_104053 [Volvox carteri f. nagariensis]|uniref:Exostosin GT47 domain-containing protein n=1 Tax=Volvox carteri f. nagariensis TaxID=3068 RepID=D8TQW8_VOLCA|nr:uncharacterized protein VOLCADRAFT_104053 [Volvox carteri f. nagariensis]EFJ50229.1 hypothetical protein VOLCADRAFT_104053 [Volvox carteri f. nagariensis]|eukprot:XP_002948849.1 hypothetical protein VOLCADRAFT_104053 [Volvox carteri f. nagariensis]